MADGTRDPATGEPILDPVTVDIPEDAIGTLRLSFKITTSDGRTCCPAGSDSR